MYNYPICAKKFREVLQCPTSLFLEELRSKDTLRLCQKCLIPCPNIRQSKIFHRKPGKFTFIPDHPCLKHTDTPAVWGT